MNYKTLGGQSFSAACAYSAGPVILLHEDIFYGTRLRRTSHDDPVGVLVSISPSLLVLPGTIPGLVLELLLVSIFPELPRARLQSGP